MIDFAGLGWLVLLLAALAFLQRRLHFETQALFLLLTRRPEIALVLFSLLLFPGVLLHEASHFLAARLLGVRTGRFSLLPRPMPGGRLQLGYVETSQSDPVRDALIGSAPFLVGGLFVAYAGLAPLSLPDVWEPLSQGQLVEFWTRLFALPARPDFYLWFYLTFAVSSTMLPSPSDRRAWLPILVLVLLLVGLALLAGAGPWMVTHLAPRLNQGMRALGMMFAISASVHLAILLPLWVLRSSLAQLFGLRVT
jgi:hypothetical protein